MYRIFRTLITNQYLLICSEILIAEEGGERGGGVLLVDICRLN